MHLKHTSVAAKWVYCYSHRRPHRPRWCAELDAHIPLPAVSLAEAVQVARAMGLYVYGDSRPCQHCGYQVTVSADCFVTGSGSSTCSYSATGHSPETMRLLIVS